LKISLSKRNECPLGCYRSLVGIAIGLEQEITKYCQHSGENSRPSASFIAEEFVPDLIQYVLVTVCFLIAGVCFVCMFVCIMHGLERGRPFWLLLAILAFFLAIAFSHIIWLLTRK
jgi:hypothetical protein